MRFSLAALTRRVRNPRRRQIPLREIVPTASLAADLFGIYKPILISWSGSLARIQAAYERYLAEVSARDGIRDSVSDIQSALDFAAEEISRLLLVLTPELRRWALRVERYHRSKWRGAVLSATGVDLETMIGAGDVAESLNVVIARNAALVRNVSDQAQSRISDIVFRGFTARTPARTVAKEMAEAVGMGRQRALRIASHQMSSLTAELDDERRRQAGMDTWKWRHSGKQNFRPEHKARDGNIYTDENAPSDRPGRLPGCACRSQSVLILQ